MEEHKTLQRFTIIEGVIADLTDTRGDFCIFQIYAARKPIGDAVHGQTVIIIHVNGYDSFAESRLRLIVSGGKGFGSAGTVDKQLATVCVKIPLKAGILGFV